MPSHGHKLRLSQAKERHHPITFSNDQTGYVVWGYRQDMFRYDKISRHGLNWETFPQKEEDIPML